MNYNCCGPTIGVYTGRYLQLSGSVLSLLPIISFRSSFSVTFDILCSITGESWEMDVNAEYTSILVYVFKSIPSIPLIPSIRIRKNTSILLTPSIHSQKYTSILLTPSIRIQKYTSILLTPSIRIQKYASILLTPSIRSQKYTSILLTPSIRSQKYTSILLTPSILIQKYTYPAHN